jgi:hypothetical protein
VARASAPASAAERARQRRLPRGGDGQRVAQLMERRVRRSLGAAAATGGRRAHLRAGTPGPRCPASPAAT